MNNKQWFDFISGTTDNILTRHTIGGQFLEISDHGLKLLGYTIEELLNMSPCRFIHNDDSDAVRHYHTLLVNERISQWIHYRFKKKDNSYVALQSFGKIIMSQSEPEGLEIVFYTKTVEENTRDRRIIEMNDKTVSHPDTETSSVNSMNNYYNKLISEHSSETKQKISTYNSEEEHRILYRAISHSTNGITIADCRLPDMPLVFANRAFEHMTGYSIEEVIGKNCRFLQNNDTKQVGLDLLRKAIINAEPVKVVLRNYKKDGSLFWNKLELAPVRDNEGSLTHFVGIASDITQEVIAKKEITDLNMRLAETNDLLRGERDSERQHARTLQKLNDMKNDFVSSVSHEFRTPLASIIGFAQTLLRDKNLPEQLREKFTRIIHDDGKRLARIVEDLLDIARIESGKTALNKKINNIADIVREAIATAQYDAEKNNTRIVPRLQIDNVMVFCDRDKIIQVLLNLLTNACKFSQPSSYIILKVDENETHVILSVADNGVGIHPEDIPHIFEKFYRVKQPGREIRGTGLGLPIAKNLIELHYGTISVKSTLGVGSEFTFTIPKHHE